MVNKIFKCIDKFIYNGCVDESHAPLKRFLLESEVTFYKNLSNNPQQSQIYSGELNRAETILSDGIILTNFNDRPIPQHDIETGTSFSKDAVFDGTSMHII